MYNYLNISIAEIKMFLCGASSPDLLGFPIYTRQMGLLIAGKCWRTSQKIVKIWLIYCIYGNCDTITSTILNKHIYYINSLQKYHMFKIVKIYLFRLTNLHRSGSGIKLTVKRIIALRPVGLAMRSSSFCWNILLNKLMTFYIFCWGSSVLFLYFVLNKEGWFMKCLNASRYLRLLTYQTQAVYNIIL